MHLQTEFNAWLDKILQNFGTDFQAYCFNIYESTLEGDYAVELTAFDEFDEYDADWNCGGTEAYASRNDGNEFTFNDHRGWEKCLETVGNFVAEYLNRGTYRDKLKSAEAVAYGFVDGDAEFAYQK